MRVRDACLYKVFVINPARQVASSFILPVIVRSDFQMTTTNTHDPGREAKGKPKERPEKSGKDQLEKKTKDFLAQTQKQGIDAKSLAAIIKSTIG
jgi:hypothetical protein